MFVGLTGAEFLSNAPRRGFYLKVNVFLNKIIFFNFLLKYYTMCSFLLHAVRHFGFRKHTTLVCGNYFVLTMKFAGHGAT